MQFRDLKRQYETIKESVDNAFFSVMEESAFINGRQVRELEEKLAEYVGVKNCITCANGTDALQLALMTWGIGKGDAIFVPDFTFFSSGEAPAIVGATPIFVDVDERTFNIDPEKLEIAIKQIISEKELIPRVVIAVDLFGQPADYCRIKGICQRYDLLLLEDGAQGFGGSIGERKACSFGDISTTSFFPAKPLGCYGDGGAVFTDNDECAEIIRSLCVHGKAKDDKYVNARIGMNSRLDTIQAAILLAKFEAFKSRELEDVKNASVWYNKRLENTEITIPFVLEGFDSSWAQFTIQLPDKSDRDLIQRNLKEAGIPTNVYYPKPMHAQEAFSGTRSAIADCPVTERLCKKVLSLPIHPYIEKYEVETILSELLKG